MPTGHVSYSMSQLDLDMIASVPQGGNWKDIPLSVPSKRLDQIRLSGGRTTLYGRLAWDKPSFTITTYFNRPGNGTYVHPDSDRMITSAEAARFQSFPDSFTFSGSKTMRTKQIGNAVPPLLAYQIAKQIMVIDPKCRNMVDLFCGAGGLSLGFEWANFNCLVANDNFKNASETYQANFARTDFVFGDIVEPSTKQKILEILKDKEAVDIVVGGPPCQGFSNAGKRLIDDPRNKLYKEFIDIVVITKPRVVLMENVEGILSMENGRVFSEIRKDLEKLGYFVEAKKLNTVEYGIPQRRKRVIIIGSREANAGLMFPARITDITQPLTTRDAIGDLPLDPVVEIETNVKPKKPSSSYQELMQGRITPEKFINDLKSNH
jgi:DNA (cytosine-5)-methyltransferase 1